MTTNTIHPTAIIDPSVQLGRNNYIGPFCVLMGDIKIGDNNRFEAYVSVGTPPEHRSFWNGKYGGVRIGSGCVIREFVTINAGTSRNTLVHDDVIMLRGSHLGHDAVIHKGVTLSCNVLIGGESMVMEGANLGLGAIVHQKLVVPPFVMLGMGAIVTKKSSLRPFQTYVGNPAKWLKANEIGIKRSGMTAAQLKNLESAYERVRESYLQEIAR